MADPMQVEVVSADDDRRGQLPRRDNVIESQTGLFALAVAEPADAGWQPLEVHALPRELDPARERLVLGEQLEHVHRPHEQIVEVHRVHPQQLGLVEPVDVGDRLLGVAADELAVCIGVAQLAGFGELLSSAILSLALEVEGRDDIVIDLRAPGAVEALEKKPFSIKEGARFRMKAQFKVQHDILSGLKYLQKVSRMGVSEKLQEMMVSISAIEEHMSKH